MRDSISEINKLEEEIISLRNENQMLKEQLSQTNINSETIHNHTTETEGDKLCRQQLLNMLEPTNHETEDEYNNMSIEDIAKGYEEMGNIMLQENLELSQNIQ